MDDGYTLKTLGEGIWFEEYFLKKKASLKINGIVSMTTCCVVLYCG